MINEFLLKLTTWFKDAIIVILTWFLYCVVFWVKLFVDILLNAFSAVVSMFPDCMDCFGIDTRLGDLQTAATGTNVWDQFIWFINWLFPVTFYLELVGCIVGAFITIYPFIIVLRWVKAARA